MDEMIEEIEIVKYSLTIAEDNRIMVATFEQYNPNGVIVEELPDGDITDYLYVNGEYVYSPKPIEPKEPPEESTEELMLEILADHEMRLCEIELFGSEG